MKNYLVITLCKKLNTYLNMFKTATKLANIDHIIVSDYDNKNITDKSIIFYSDEEAKKKQFINTIPFNKTPSAWDKCFLYLSTTELKYDYYYLIEEDVYCQNFETFFDLFRCLEKYKEDLITCDFASKKKDPNWCFWGLYDLRDDIEYYHSLNCFCRISKNLIKTILDIFPSQKPFYAEEILIPTICMNNNMTILNYKVEKEIMKFFGPMFGTIDVKKQKKIKPQKNKIIHPIKYELSQDLKY